MNSTTPDRSITLSTGVVVVAFIIDDNTTEWCGLDGEPLTAEEHVELVRILHVNALADRRKQLRDLIGRY